MNKTLQRILSLVSKGEVRISDHGYDELAEDNIFARNIIDGVREAIVVENYPDYPKGLCVLVLQKDQDGRPVLWFGEFPDMPTRPPWSSRPIGLPQHIIS